jgi:hypothetical protein
MSKIISEYVSRRKLLAKCGAVKNASH